MFSVKVFISLLISWGILVIATCVSSVFVSQSKSSEQKWSNIVITSEDELRSYDVIAQKNHLVDTDVQIIYKHCIARLVLL